LLLSVVRCGEQSAGRSVIHVQQAVCSHRPDSPCYNLVPHLAKVRQRSEINTLKLHRASRRGSTPYYYDL